MSRYRQKLVYVDAFIVGPRSERQKFIDWADEVGLTDWTINGKGDAIVVGAGTTRASSAKQNDWIVAYSNGTCVVYSEKEFADTFEPAFQKSKPAQHVRGTNGHATQS